MTFNAVRSKGAALGAAALALTGIAILGTTSLASCAQTPTAVPVQTFDRPQNLDVVCMQVNNGNVNDFQSVIPPIPLPQSACAQVQPANTVPNLLPNHLFALVTQTARGQVAVVDLTAGFVVDENSSTPGINLLPVGRLPSDIASSPDGKMTYVAAADPNVPAIYALPSTIILGDEEIANVTSGTNPPANPVGVVVPDLTTWPVCALPQPPGAIAVLPISATSLADGGALTDLGPSAGGAAASDDAGAASDGGDAGTPTTTTAASTGPGYVIAVVLPGDTSHPARVGVIDPSPLIRGALAEVPDSGVSPEGTVDTPGQLVPCSFVSYVSLAAPTSATWSPAPAWDDGVAWVDGGEPGDQPQTAATCVATADGGLAADGGAMVAGLGGSPFGGYAALDLAGPRPIYYVADAALPLIHVLDLSDPNRIVELSPLLATSIDQPQRGVTVGQLAVSPSTHEYKRFLYAVDVVQGSLMVFDVTDPVNGPRTPMLRPHPELDPFQPTDRISFAQPVATVAFASHDWPILPSDVPGQAYTGLLCNPNPNVDINKTPGSNADLGPFSDPGAYYRANVGTGVAGAAVAIGPSRLRGVFAFATLTNGEVEAIDVDDWDAPCRRPDPISASGTRFKDHQGEFSSPLLSGPYNGITPPQPSDAGDVDPYHAPYAFAAWNNQSPVTLEAYYPVSAPHRARSFYFLTNDPVNGDHAPGLTTLPQLFLQGSPQSAQPSAGVYNPNIVPTDTPYVDYALQQNPTVADPSARAFTIATSASAASTEDGGPVATADASVPDSGVVTTASGSTFVVASPRDQSFPIAPPNVRFSYEDPRAYTDQNWYVTYEGSLPGFFDSGGDPLVIGNLASTDGWNTLTVTNETAGFCGKGIEDYAVGTQRARATLAALAAAGLPTTVPSVERLDHKVADYVQFVDDILDVTDPYWQLADVNGCWDGLGPQYEPAGGPTATADPATANARLAICDATFGHTYDATTVSPSRDFPILEAYADHLVVGRFGPKEVVDAGAGGGISGGREVVSSDPTNVPFLKLAQCCFHSQMNVNVRTGGEWSVVGSSSGFLNHVVATGADNRCAPSCDPRAALLNGRSPAIPRPPSDANGIPIFTASIDRDNALAMRNPMMSFLIWNGLSGGEDAIPVRDLQWQFSTRGQFVDYAVNIASASSSVSPQSMLYINTLGQLAVIDGSSQGLVLIDLDTLTEAHSPYF